MNKVPENSQMSALVSIDFLYKVCIAAQEAMRLLSDFWLGTKQWSKGEGGKNKTDHLTNKEREKKRRGQNEEMEKGELQGESITKKQKLLF